MIEDIDIICPSCGSEYCIRYHKEAIINEITELNCVFCATELDVSQYIEQDDNDDDDEE